LFSVVLFEPEIPPNTGNVIRLCANTGCALHLIEPLGFSMQEKQMRRAGLDYHALANVQTWKDWPTFIGKHDQRVLSFSTKNKKVYSSFDFEPGDTLLFGSETRGLPEELYESIPLAHRLHIPMLPKSRSLNLSNTVALAVYEAWRQCQFRGAVNQ